MQKTTAIYVRVSSRDQTRRLHQHRSWVNEKPLTACDLLSDEEVRQPFQIGQGSIWKSLLHLYAAEYVWLEVLLGNDDPVLPGDEPGKLPGNQQGEGGITSFGDLKERWADLTSRWDSYFAGLTPEMLGEVVYKRNTSSGLGKHPGTRRADVLLHVCTHAQYTTAQIINMLRQAGVTSLPDVMLISLARQEAEYRRRRECSLTGE